MSCRAELSLVNGVSTSVPVNTSLNLGNVVRKRRAKNDCGNYPIDQTGNNGVIINKPGYYRFLINLTFTAPTDGNVTISLLQNGIAVPGYTATVTIATTQVVSLAIVAPDIRVYCGNVPSIFTFNVSGVDITTSNVAVSVLEV